MSTCLHILFLFLSIICLIGPIPFPSARFIHRLHTVRNRATLEMLDIRCDSTTSDGIGSPNPDANLLIGNMLERRLFYPGSAKMYLPIRYTNQSNILLEETQISDATSLMKLGILLDLIQVLLISTIQTIQILIADLNARRRSAQQRLTGIEELGREILIRRYLICVPSSLAVLNSRTL